MRREVEIEDLQKLYSAGDMVKAGCNGCSGCSKCCEGMGESVILDPLDVHRLAQGLKMEFHQLLQNYLELHPVEKIVLPNLRMDGADERCGFLNDEGRCSVHAYRPGLCRLFPLGRYYENGTFRYFLQQKECPMQPKTKVKVSKWVDTPDLKKYERYVLKWHYFLEEAGMLLEKEADDQFDRDFNTYFLKTFFIAPYVQGRDFYEQFDERLMQMNKLLKVLGRRDENGRKL